MLGEHVDRQVTRPVFVLAEEVGDIIDREDGADRRHGQAARLCGAVWSAPPQWTVRAAVEHVFARQKGSMALFVLTGR